MSDEVKKQEDLFYKGRKARIEYLVSLSDRAFLQYRDQNIEQIKQIEERCIALIRSDLIAEAKGTIPIELNKKSYLVDVRNIIDEVYRARKKRGDFDDEMDNKDRMISALQGKIIQQRNRLKLGKRPDRNELMKHADACRKKNETINYSKLAKVLGISNHTAKQWCNDVGVK